MPSDSDASVVTLPDGRRPGYAEYGDPAGVPVFYFHGTQSSRLERHPDESIARGHGARVILSSAGSTAPSSQAACTRHQG